MKAPKSTAKPKRPKLRLLPGGLTTPAPKSLRGLAAELEAQLRARRTPDGAA